MSAFNDFPVDPCVALQIKVCILLKECKLKVLRAKSLQTAKQFGPGSSTGLNAELRLSLNNSYLCLIEGLQKAYEIAGETFPFIAPPPTAIDFSVAETLATPTQTRVAADALDFLNSVMTIEFDENGTPTFIRCP